jgi:ubiquinone/menaquinone biosynthesis C-methylase UbiE
MGARAGVGVKQPCRASENPFVLPKVVADYEAWYATAGRRADHLEKVFLKRLLAGFRCPNTILEVGCGTGHFTRWFGEQGLRSVGLDLSLPMLLEAVRLDSPPCVCGDALALPFSSRSFDLVALITTLEFLPDTARALAEALRVARYGLILGVLNRQSLLGRKLRNEGGPVWGAARFFTPAGLIQFVRRAAAGKRIEIVWRTTLWPVWPGELPLPWGGFIGLAVQMVHD